MSEMMDLETLLGMQGILPLLEELQHLLKQCQKRNIFVHDLADVLTNTTEALTRLYVDTRTRYVLVADTDTSEQPYIPDTCSTCFNL